MPRTTTEATRLRLERFETQRRAQIEARKRSLARRRPGATRNLGFAAGTSSDLYSDFMGTSLHVDELLRQ